MEEENYIIKNLEKDELISILAKYCEETLHANIKGCNTRINWDESLSLNIYFEKYGYGSTYIICVNDNDIYNCLDNYANDIGLNLVNLKYLGEMKEDKYNYHKSSPSFKGIRLYLKEKTKTKIKK